MIEIDGKQYSQEYIKKAIKLFESLCDGSLEAEIVEMMK